MHAVEISRKASAYSDSFAGLVLAAGSGGLKEPPTIFWRAKVIGRIPLCTPLPWSILNAQSSSVAISCANCHWTHSQSKQSNLSQVIAALESNEMPNSRQKYK